MEKTDLKRFGANCLVMDGKVISYETHVATIDKENEELIVHGKWSKTTSRHINEVARFYGLKKVQE